MNDDVDRLAFTEFADRQGPAVLGYLTRRVTIKEDAADLLSEVLLTAWRRWDTVPRPPDDRPWLFVVARNVLANHHRSTRRRDTATRALAQTLGRLGADAPEPSATVLDVRAAINSLQPLDREILTLTVWDGLTSAEVATVVGLPSSTVRARLARARAQVKDRLAPDRDTAVRREAGLVVAAPNDARNNACPSPAHSAPSTTDPQ